MRKYINETKGIVKDWVISQAQSIGGGVMPEDIMGGIAKSGGVAKTTTTQTPSNSVQKNTTEQAGIVDMGDGIEAFGE
jgi:hypothetical protein